MRAGGQADAAGGEVWGCLAARPVAHEGRGSTIERCPPDALHPVGQSLADRVGERLADSVGILLVMREIEWYSVLLVFHNL